jgi:RNA polymerase sigma-70 factor, ECF subfamily
VVALERWPRDGVPPNPAAWIALTARRKAIDRLRAERRAPPAPLATAPAEPPSPIPDERLELIFACCHPALAP